MDLPVEEVLPLTMVHNFWKWSAQNRVDPLIDQARRRGEFLSRQLASLQETHPSVGQVRSIGLFGALELVNDSHTNAPMVLFNNPSPAMQALRKRLLELGVFVYLNWNIVLISTAAQYL
jgi:taurine--2-oxoglutarate transaminase